MDPSEPEPLIQQSGSDPKEKIGFQHFGPTRTRKHSELQTPDRKFWGGDEWCPPPSPSNCALRPPDAFKAVPTAVWSSDPRTLVTQEASYKGWGKYMGGVLTRGGRMNGGRAETRQEAAAAAYLRVVKEQREPAVS